MTPDMDLQENISKKEKISEKRKKKQMQNWRISQPLLGRTTLWQLELWMQLQASATESRKISPSADLIIPL